MSMEIGVYHEFHCRPEQTPAEAFAEALDQIEAADRWGLDAIWLAEIHQQARRSVMSAPMTVASAIAARTKRIKIGTGVQVLPLCHPLRLSEETFPSLGEAGYPIFVAVRSGSLSGLAPDLAAYRQAYKEAGHPGEGEVYLRLTLHIADTDRQARDEAETSIMSGYRTLSTRLENSPNRRRAA